MRDGEEIQDNMNPVENLPNHDDTYQMTVDLNVSSIAFEDWKRYDCVFKLSNNTIITRLEKAAINTNFGKLPLVRNYTDSIFGLQHFHKNNVIT